MNQPSNIRHIGHIHLDPIGGAAGDMFIAGMLDAAPHLEAGMLEAIAMAGMPAQVQCHLIAHRDGTFVGKRFSVTEEKSAMASLAGQASEHSSHQHTSHSSVRKTLIDSALPDAVKEHALGIFALLAGAEARVHGMSVDDVSFHELGEWDSIADIVGAAYLIEAHRGCTWSCAPLPLGRGRVRSAHGWLPVPAPAVSLLMEGMSVIDDGLDGERVTPTGAAILRYLGVSQAPRKHVLQMGAMGIGFGQRRFPGLSNVLRVLSFTAQDAGQVIGRSERDVVDLIEFEIDDQSGEDLAAGLDRLRDEPGVLDVLQMPAFGKKGRMSVHVQVMVKPEATDAAAAACFLQTTTLGVRVRETERRCLTRTLSQHVMNEGDSEPDVRLNIKLAQRPQGGSSVKVEADDLSARTSTQAEREALRRKVETDVLSGKSQQKDK